MNNAKEMSNRTEITAESANGIFEQITAKLNGEQITRIAVSALKYGTICFVAYFCGVEGLKAMFGNMDTDDETIAA